MTFWDLINNNWTKILGSIATVLSTLTALAASGAFDGLISINAIKWISILGIVVSAAVTGVGVRNSTAERVATAMQDAINASPPKEQP
jgi:hypothetical protein